MRQTIVVSGVRYSSNNKGQFRALIRTNDKGKVESKIGIATITERSDDIAVFQVRTYNGIYKEVFITDLTFFEMFNKN